MTRNPKITRTLAFDHMHIDKLKTMIMVEHNAFRIYGRKCGKKALFCSSALYSLTGSFTKPKGAKRWNLILMYLYVAITPYFIVRKPWIFRF